MIQFSCFFKLTAFNQRIGPGIFRLLDLLRGIGIIAELLKSFYGCFIFPALKCGLRRQIAAVCDQLGGIFIILGQLGEEGKRALILGILTNLLCAKAKKNKEQKEDK